MHQRTSVTSPGTVHEYLQLGPQALILFVFEDDDNKNIGNQNRSQGIAFPGRFVPLRHVTSPQSLFIFPHSPRKPYFQNESFAPAMNRTIPARFFPMQFMQKLPCAWMGHFQFTTEDAKETMNLLMQYEMGLDLAIYIITLRNKVSQAHGHLIITTSNIF